MPKVSAEKAKKIAAATDPFAPIPKGFVRLKLVKVESGKSSKGDAMWTWYFKAPDFPGKEIRHWTVLKYEWTFKQLFDAFGVAYDTDTDDLLGREIVVEIDHRPSRLEVRKGKLDHYIAGFPDPETEPRLFEEDEEDQVDEVTSSGNLSDSDDSADDDSDDDLPPF